MVVYDDKILEELIVEERKTNTKKIRGICWYYIGHIRLVSVSDSNYSRINYRGDSNYIFINSK